MRWNIYITRWPGQLTRISTNSGALEVTMIWDLSAYGLFQSRIRRKFGGSWGGEIMGVSLQDVGRTIQYSFEQLVGKLCSINL